MRTFSSRHIVRGSLLAAGLTALALFGPAAAQNQADPQGNAGALVNLTIEGGSVRAAGAQVTVQGTATDIQAAGASVGVRATTTGDVQLVGAQVTFGGVAGGDLQIAGASIEVRGSVGDDLSLIGAVIVANAIVGGDAMLGGATVTLGPGSDVSGSLKAGGATVTISGHIAGKVDLAGALVTINATTDGSVEARAAQVVVNSAARISGDLIVYSLRDPIIAEGAVVTGQVVRHQPPTFGAPPWVWRVGFAVFVALGTMLAGIVLLLFGGHVFSTATDHVRHRPLSSFLFGILTLVLVPFVAAILMATIIGISVGFAVLFVLPFLVVFGHAVAAAGIAGGLLVRRPGELGVFLNLVMLIVGAIILVLIGLIPWVGPALVGVAIVLGLGAFTRTIGHRIRRPAAPAPLV